MKAITEYREKTEPMEETLAAKRYNPSCDILVTAFGRRLRLKSGHGSTDDVYLFRENDALYLLSLNTRYGYCGLTAYDKDDALETTAQGKPVEETDSIFLQDDSEIEETLGRKGLDLSPMTIAKRLAEYLFQS